MCALKAKAESRPSPIHGDGYFAIEKIERLESIETGKRGHGFNSSCNANVEIVPLKTTLKLGHCTVFQQVVIAIRPIAVDEELTVNYRWHPCNCTDCRLERETSNQTPQDNGDLL